MSGSWSFFLLLIFCCFLIQGFFALMEMASVSFNKVRLQYYVSKGNRRAIWLSHLLHTPARLFGTTLICLNAALQLGSECSRRFYEALSISPDWAPLTQIPLVLIFAEIAPLFAGRRYAEHAVMLGIPFLYACSIVLRPVIWIFEGLSRFVHHLIGSPQGAGLYLSREELQRILEEREELNTVVATIFSLKLKKAKELMYPLATVQVLPAFCTVGEVRQLLTSNYSPYLPLYHKIPQNIVAIAYPRDLLREEGTTQVRNCARLAWFITEEDSMMSILKQFRHNNQSLAVVLNEGGMAVGILTLDAIVDEIFGREEEWSPSRREPLQGDQIIVDRTFPGEMKIVDFNQIYRVHLEGKEVETLAELVAQLLGHPPAAGEKVRIDRFELTVEEASFIEAKMISIRTI